MKFHDRYTEIMEAFKGPDENLFLSKFKVDAKLYYNVKKIIENNEKLEFKGPSLFKPEDSVEPDAIEPSIKFTGPSLEDSAIISNYDLVYYTSEFLLYEEETGEDGWIQYHNFEKDFNEIFN